MATGPWRQAQAPPFLLPRPAGFCYADGGGRLSQRRRGCWGRRRRRRGGRKVQLARPASPSNVTLCKRQNPGAPELTRARTADAPVASSLFSARWRKPASFALLRTRSSLGSQGSSEPSQEVNPADVCLAGDVPSSHPPRPELRSLPLPHPLGVSHGQRPGTEGVSSGLESTIQHFGQRPGVAGWQACSRARNSCLRSSGKGPSKRWPLRVPRASSLPASQPANRCQGNDLVRELGTLEGSPFSCRSPEVLTGGPRQLGQGVWTMPVIPGISRRNMGNNCLCKEKAVEKGRKFFGGEQHSHRLPCKPLGFLRVGGMAPICT